MARFLSGFEISESKASYIETPGGRIKYDLHSKMSCKKNKTVKS